MIDRLFRTVFVMTAIVLTPSVQAWALLVPADSGASRKETESDRLTVQSSLEQKMVRERLKSFGLSEKEIDNRLNQLSKQQVHLLAKDIRSLNHGADGGGILGLVLVILLIVYLFERI